MADEQTINRTALDAAHLYWDNLRRLGEPGEPPVPAELHAELARTAALISIAESLDRLGSAQMERLIHSIAKNLDVLRQEFTKLRSRNFR